MSNLVLDKGLSEGRSHMFFLDVCFEQIIFKSSKSVLLILIKFLTLANVFLTILSNSKSPLQEPTLIWSGGVLLRSGINTLSSFLNFNLVFRF